MLIQVILVVGVIVIGIALARPAGGDNHLALRRLFMFGFVIVAIISIVFPQWLSWVARLVGVGRGTDLLLYTLVLAFLVFVSTTYRRNVQLGRKITQLARAVTIATARAEDARAEDHRADAAPTATGEMDESSPTDTP